jgi:hypothetical protein
MLKLRRGGVKMSKFVKIALIVSLILTLCIFGFTPVINYKEAALQEAAAAAGYTREEVKTALLHYERTGTVSKVTNTVLLPASMGITTPNLNPAMVLTETPLKEYGGKEEFYAELRAHGYDDPDMENMPYWQYEQLSGNWPLDTETVEMLYACHPVLAERDRTAWTNKDYRLFSEQNNKELLAGWFTAEQLAELKARGIQLEDTRPLLKTYYQPETILAQSDETLKAILEDWYQTKLTLSLGADWRQSARIN